MGDVVSHFFIDVSSLPPDSYGFVQLVFLGLVYGWVLKEASNLISGGSELLLLIPSVAGLVGSVVLPILGAVPDGAIVLFSGLGPLEAVQEQVSVGVGTLAGSTIMLLTIPWAMTIWFGRVSIINGTPNYVRPKNIQRRDFAKLREKDRWSLTNVGIHPFSTLRVASYMMMASALGYLIIQVPAFRAPHTPASSLSPRLARSEHPFAFVGMVVAVLLFIGYLWYSVATKDNNTMLEAEILNVQERSMQDGMVSIAGIFSDQLKNLAQQSSARRGSEVDETTALRRDNASAEFRRLVRQFFVKYDVDRSGQIDARELRLLLCDFNLHMSESQVQQVLQILDTDGNGEICFDELVEGIRRLLTGELQTIASPHHKRSPEEGLETADNDIDTAEDEEDEVPDDLRDLSPSEQRRRIITRSLWMMTAGTALVLLFSDPMVEVLSELGGNRLGIGGFYAAFVLAPLASNLSEVVASGRYAAKRTRQTSTIALQQLLGAAIMNNTFCLAIFLALIYFRHLPWVYTAETLSILMVEAAMLVVCQVKVMKPTLALCVLSLYPAALLLVWVLENVIGWN